MIQNVTNGINQLLNELKKEQNEDGSWSYPFETGIATDCYMIILLRSLRIDDEKLIMGLTERIISKQEKNGAWKLFYDEEEGNITATLEGYYSLLYSGYMSKKDPRLVKAKQFILKKGGIKETHMFTKIMLAITGQYKWPSCFPVPIELMLLPVYFPINFYQFSVYGRANLAPILILAEEKYQLKRDNSPDLSDLFVSGREDRGFNEWRGLESIIKEGIKALIGWPSELKKKARAKVKQYLLSHIEEDGTFFSYFSSTFLMIFALLSLGYKPSHPLITRAVNGLRSMKTEIEGLPHMQYTTASVWNTSLISYTLLEAGLSTRDPVIQSANTFLVKRQHHLYGDWVINNREGFPGGWGFSLVNTFNPDIDDTTTSLRAIASMAAESTPPYRQAWDRGIQWLLTMQNHDGGWPAFEKNTNSTVLKQLPIEKAEYLLTDPPTADLTGRTLEFLGNYTNLPKHHPSIQAGVRSLMRSQEEDGSWYGRWGICFIYGTWGALTGLIAAQVEPSNPSILKAVEWLKKVQNNDGGWGESCKSDSNNRYVALGESTLTHTAWAVDALISASEKPSKSVNNGISFLLENLNQQDWTTRYPKGQGMAGDFYIHLHSYRYIFPLLTLAHYKKKYEKKS